MLRPIPLHSAHERYNSSRAPYDSSPDPLHRVHRATMARSPLRGSRDDLFR